MNENKYRKLPFEDIALEVLNGTLSKQDVYKQIKKNHKVKDYQYYKAYEKAVHSSYEMFDMVLRNLDKRNIKFTDTL
jgi:hypothetical protein